MQKENDGGWLGLATDSKKANVEQLIDLREDLEEIYKIYNGLILGTESDLPESNFTDYKDLLIDYYEHPPSKLSIELKARRNDHGLNECPSCGNPLSPDTLDHFIPKDSWPEFSIFPNNLVPQCRHCAPMKSSRYYCKPDQCAIFIHPIYFDLLSRIGFRVRAQMKGKIPEFDVEFVKIGKLTIADTKRVKKHLAELNVKNRFYVYCRKEYSRWENKIKATKFNIQLALSQRISERPNEGNFSRDWKTAFYKGVLSCNAMIEHLNQLAPIEENIYELETEVID